MKPILTLTFLGTGTSQGVPVIGSTHPVCLSDDPRDKRLRASALISWKGFTYVIDCGPDFRQQMLTQAVSKLDGIFFTHEHADHTAGIDDIRPFFFRQGDIPIYAHPRVIAALQRRFDYIFASDDRYPGAPAVHINEVHKDHPLHLGDLAVMPIQAFHNRLQVFGYRFGDLVYLTDIKRMEDTEFKKLVGAKVLVVNALRQAPHHSHFNLKEALAFAQRVGAAQTYFTHISHRLGFHEEVEKKLPPNTFLAYDNLQVTL